LRRTERQARTERDSATGRLLSAYREGGNTRARDRLVELYMPLVDSLAHRHDKSGAEHDDLVQAGAIGLLNAIERFDPKRGEEFVAFAVPTVAGEIKRHIRDRAALVRLPRRLHEATTRLPQARSDLTARLGRAPTPAELASEVGVTPDDLAYLESTISSASEEIPGETDTSELDASESRLLLADAFRTLDETDRRILYLRFVGERSRREVADELGISQSALARRTNAALAKLRTELEGRRPEQGAPVPDRARLAPVEPVSGDATEPEAETAAPASKGRTGHSGRLMLRMPQSLHAELAKSAEREEVSLNQFITNTLAASLSWHTTGDEPAHERESRPSPRWLPAAILTNIVVVVIAGLLALVLLVVALQQGL
jgi:RNA polymerase sigma-B factor